MHVILYLCFLLRMIVTLVHVDPQKCSPDTCSSSRQNERVMLKQTSADGASSSGRSHRDNRTSWCVTDDASWFSDDDWWCFMILSLARAHASPRCCSWVGKQQHTAVWSSLWNGLELKYTDNTNYSCKWTTKHSRCLPFSLTGVYVSLTTVLFVTIETSQVYFLRHRHYII